MTHPQIMSHPQIVDQPSTNLGNCCTNKRDIFKLPIKFLAALEYGGGVMSLISGVLLAKQPTLDKQNTRKNPQNLLFFLRFSFH